MEINLDLLSHTKPSGDELWIMTLLSPAFKTSTEGKGVCIIHTTWVLSWSWMCVVLRVEVQAHGAGSGEVHI